MTDLERLEADIAGNKLKVELAEALITLEKSKPFKKLFTKTYLRDYALGMLTFKGSMQAQEAKVQSHVDYQLAGIAGLQQFLANVRQAGIVALESIRSDEATRTALLADEE